VDDSHRVPETRPLLAQTSNRPWVQHRHHGIGTFIVLLSFTHWTVDVEIEEGTLRRSFSGCQGEGNHYCAYCTSLNFFPGTPFCGFTIMPSCRLRRGGRSCTSKGNKKNKNGGQNTTRSNDRGVGGGGVSSRKYSAGRQEIMRLSVIDRIMMGSGESSGSFLLSESPSAAFSGSSAGVGVSGGGARTGTGSATSIRRSSSSNIEPTWQEWSMESQLSRRPSRAELRRLSSDEFTVNKLNVKEVEVYGRQKEIAVLRQAFQEVKKGNGKKVIVSIEGYSGIGKTVLAQMLRADVLHQNKGLVCVGKFDLQNHAEPYTAIVAALSQLVDLLLQKDASFVREMKRKLRCP
jgi:AAA ATPase domain